MSTPRTGGRAGHRSAVHPRHQLANRRGRPGGRVVSGIVETDGVLVDEDIVGESWCDESEDEGGE